MTKRLYTGFSFFEFINMLFLRLACVFGLIFTLPHYDENPVLIIIVSAICLLFIFILGDDQIIVYQDRVTQITNSFSSLIFELKNGDTVKFDTNLESNKMKKIVEIVNSLTKENCHYLGFVQMRLDIVTSAICKSQPHKSLPLKNSVE